MFKLAFLLVNAIAICSSTIILPAAPNSVGPDVGVVFVQGAQIASKNYKEFFEQLQAKFNGSRLWVALTEFPFSVPEPIFIGSRINDGFKKLTQAGMTITKETSFFFVGHSLGGVFLQDYILDKKKQNSMPCKVVGLVLEGSYITRKNYEKIKDPSLIPSILSISGELDGLNRISRMSESFHYDMKHNNTGVTRMTLIVPGMNHYQFAGQGEAPFLVNQNDIEAEITDFDAQDQATHIISAFMKKILQINTEKESNRLDSSFERTAALLTPLIEAFKMEGSYHFYTPCYTLDNPEGTDCLLGSPWSEISQQIMGSSNVSMVVTDSFHPVYQVNPVHLPAIHNECSKPYECALNITTVSEPIYSLTDSQDISLNACGASEIKTKMMSRQSIFSKASGIVYDLEETDGGNSCAEINQATIDWAVSKTPKYTLDRYLRKGVQLRVGDDKGPYNIGPLWIWTYLAYNKKTDPITKKPYIELRSPMMYTSVTYPIPLARAFHYCKVLSPARAMEWIFVDSLKP